MLPTSPTPRPSTMTAPAGDHGNLLHAGFADFQHITHVADIDFLIGFTHIQCKLGMFAQMFLLAVNRNEILRFGERLHQFKLFLTGVAGNVDFVH